MVFDRNTEQTHRLAAEGAVGADSLDDLISRLTPPRAVWVMVPAGEATETTIDALAQKLQADDILIDGGNSYFKDDVRRATTLGAQGLRYGMSEQAEEPGDWSEGYC